MQRKTSLQIPKYSIYLLEFISYTPRRMKVSQKGFYALRAMMMLARNYNRGAIRIRDIAYEEQLPQKFLELILREMKEARMVESIRGAKGGYQLRRPPSELRLSEIVRLIDWPLAPFSDAEQLRTLIARDTNHRSLYRIFLEVRNAAAHILERTTLADIVAEESKEASPQEWRRRKGITDGSPQ
jgi:Rrf2 family protein